MVHEGEWLLTPDVVRQFEQAGLVTPTFRRLEPERQHAITIAILDDAFERGPGRVRLKETAAAAGVSVGSLYQYFGSQQAIVDFAIELVAGILAGELRSYIPALRQLPLRDGLEAWLSGGVEWSQSHSAVMRYFARAAYDGDPAISGRLVRPIAEAMLEAMTAMVTAASERGELRAGIDPDVAASVLHAALSAIVDASLLPHLGGYLLPGAVPPADTRSAAIDIVIRGLS